MAKNKLVTGVIRSLLIGVLEYNFTDFNWVIFRFQPLIFRGANQPFSILSVRHPPSNGSSHPHPPSDIPVVGIESIQVFK